MEVILAYWFLQNMGLHTTTVLAMQPLSYYLKKTSVQYDFFQGIKTQQEFSPFHTRSKNTLQFFRLKGQTCKPEQLLLIVHYFLLYCILII